LHYYFIEISSAGSGSGGFLSHDILSAGGATYVGAYARARQTGSGVSAPGAIAAQCAPQGAAALTVEITESARLTGLDAEWRDLLRRADAPNVFMTPATIKLAGETHPDTRRIAVLAWQKTGRGKHLAGVWAFAIRRAPQSILPMNVLAAPAMGHAYLATPVIDRDLLEEALAAMLDAIAADARLPHFVALDAMATDGATMQALSHVLRARGGAPCVLTEARRPMLASALDGRQYLQQALSGSSRKKLRQHRRRLAEKGRLEYRIDSAPEAVGQAVEAFLQLEASGWKGRQGTALLSDAADAAFVRSMVPTLAQQGDAQVHALYLEGKPLSVQIVLRAGTAAFTWKTAYDEAWRDASPGMLLLEDYTAAFLADDSIAYVDSCAYDETSFMAAWSERQAIASLWFDVRPGTPLSFTLAFRIQKIYAVFRAAAKRMHQKYTRPAR
jgi:CelD/BcsL family acetyltransferase involved in cellulose biosynthesis